MRARALTLILAGAGLAVTALPSPAAASSSGFPVYDESPADALARNVRILADSPRSFDALIGAGKAALQLGDAQAAAGFFGRAEEVNPNSPLPKAGVGAALVATDDPRTALTYFAEALRLGAAPATIGCDRGLAYDLLGNPTAAQADYRAALNGSDRDEARRRLALSLAISGKKAEALTTLAPLLQQRDAGAVRVRALVLALNGEFNTARTVLDTAMPGAGARMEPFFRRLPALGVAQKAAAVHLGILDDGPAMAASGGVPDVGGDRLASIEELLKQPPPQVVEAPPAAQRYAYSPPPAAPSVAPRQLPPVQLASVPKQTIRQAAKSPNNDLIQTKRVASDPGGRKIWLQLASGANEGELPSQFKRIRARDPSLFTGIHGFIADSGSRSRLLIGPFHSQEDARLFADALANARIDSFAWTSQPGQVVRPLSSQ